MRIGYLTLGTLSQHVPAQRNQRFCDARVCEQRSYGFRARAVRYAGTSGRAMRTDLLGDFRTS